MWDNVIRYVDYGLRWLNVDVSMIRAINENQLDAESLYMEQELPDFTPGLVAINGPGESSRFPVVWHFPTIPHVKCHA